MRRGFQTRACGHILRIEGSADLTYAVLQETWLGGGRGDRNEARSVSKELMIQGLERSVKIL